MNNTRDERKQGDELTGGQLIKSGLEDQVTAVARYEDIIWKVRSGYVVILVGALTLILGEKGVPNICALTNDFGHSLALFSLILGISLSVFVIDFSYVRKKLKFVVAREMLIDLACDVEFDIHSYEEKQKLRKLLHITGETRPSSLSDEGNLEYRSKRTWNLAWILLPIYTPIPALAIVISILCRYQSLITGRICS